MLIKNGYFKLTLSVVYAYYRTSKITQVHENIIVFRTNKAKSIAYQTDKRGSVELFFYKNEFALVYRLGDA